METLNKETIQTRIDKLTQEWAEINKKESEAYKKYKDANRELEDTWLELFRKKGEIESQINGLKVLQNSEI